MQPLLHLKYELKKDLILKESEEAKKLSIFHTDGRYPNKVFTDWKVSIYSGNYIEQIMKDFDRDYWMDAKQAIEYGIADKLVEKI